MQGSANILDNLLFNDTSDNYGYDGNNMSMLQNRDKNKLHYELEE